MKVSFALLAMLILGGAVVPVSASSSTPSSSHKPHKVKKHKGQKHHNS